MKKTIYCCDICKAEFSWQDVWFERPLTKVFVTLFHGDLICDDCLEAIKKLSKEKRKEQV